LIKGSWDAWLISVLGDESKRLFVMGEVVDLMRKGLRGAFFIVCGRKGIMVWES
jgi:hypothetical protein